MKNREVEEKCKPVKIYRQREQKLRQKRKANMARGIQLEAVRKGDVAAGTKNIIDFAINTFLSA